MNQAKILYYIAVMLLIPLGLASNSLCAQSMRNGQDAYEICKPELSGAQTIEMGHSGIFDWKCDENRVRGAGFYIVFIRPTGTYVLLKVPIGKNSFEFTPDVAGAWRWMVINTDPDRSKPDVESEPGHFQVINIEQ